MGSPPITRCSLKRCTPQQRFDVCVKHIDGWTAKKITAWLLTEHEVEYRFDSIKLYLQSQAAMDMIDELRVKMHAQMMEQALAQKAVRVACLSSEAAKMGDYLDGFDFSNVDDKKYLTVLSHFSRTLAQLRDETEKVETHVEHTMISPFEKFFDQMKRTESKAIKDASPQ